MARWLVEPGFVVLLALLMGLLAPAVEAVPPAPTRLDTRIQQDAPGPLSAPPSAAYRRYLRQSAAITQSLLALQPALQTNGLGLQKLAAISASLSQEHRRLTGTFQQGESALRSQQAMAQAVATLADLVYYWRQSTRFRPLLRNSLFDAAADDAVMQAKRLQVLRHLATLQALQNLRNDLEGEEATP